MQQQQRSQKPERTKQLLFNVTQTILWQGNNMVLQQQQEPSCSLLHAKSVWIKVVDP
jgi:hypothetical protein